MRADFERILGLPPMQMLEADIEDFSLDYRELMGVVGYRNYLRLVLSTGHPHLGEWRNQAIKAGITPEQVLRKPGIAQEWIDDQFLKSRIHDCNEDCPSGNNLIDTNAPYRIIPGQERHSSYGIRRLGWRDEYSS